MVGAGGVDARAHHRPMLSGDVLLVDGIGENADTALKRDVAR